MDNFLKFLIVAILLIIAAVAITIFLKDVNKKNNIKKMYFEIESFLQGLIPEDKKDSIILEKEFKPEYDYAFKTEEYTYLIKVIPNMVNEEICVNNSVKWQLRRSFNDESMRFVENVEGLMRLDCDSKFKKLYIIYPNARSLLKYINECEMVFVNPDTDVYGANIVSFLQLKENPNLLKIIKEM